MALPKTVETVKHALRNVSEEDVAWLLTEVVRISQGHEGTPDEAVVFALETLELIGPTTPAIQLIEGAHEATTDPQTKEVLEDMSYHIRANLCTRAEVVDYFHATVLNAIGSPNPVLYSTLQTMFEQL